MLPGKNAGTSEICSAGEYKKFPQYQAKSLYSPERNVYTISGIIHACQALMLVDVQKQG